MSRPGAAAQRGGTALGPLSHSFAAAAGSNSIGKPSEKSQGDHAEAVNTLTARVTAVFHIKELESSKEGRGWVGGYTSSFPVMTSILELIFFDLCCN